MPTESRRSYRLESTPVDIRGVLFDLDGTLYQDGEAIPGAVEAVGTLRAHGVAVCFATNTTGRSRATLVRNLTRLGIPAEIDDILQPPYLAARYLKAQGCRRAYILVREDTFREFSGIDHVETKAEFVVVGDLGDGWSFRRLNQAFRLVMDGAEIIALGMTRSWVAPDGLRLDAGPFVAALEYATGKAALVLGKPAPAFFHFAVRTLGLPPEQIAMVGDDIEVDVVGAQQAGLAGILVRTGKFQPRDLSGPATPDLVIDSVADLVQIIAPQRRDPHVVR
jgi:HAD superfamily hydrolase (TIGR01458 family)